MAVMRRHDINSDPEPWIEKMILNYGSEKQGASLRAHVVGVSDLMESQHTDVGDDRMLFLSDGKVFIPTMLSVAAWEQMQELEERESLCGLENTTVSVQKYQMKFYMNPDLMSSQFYLKINQLVSVGRVSLHRRPPSCASLPSVKQHILKIWRSEASLMKQTSGTSVSSQPELPLSCLMSVWHNDVVLDLLNDAIKKISTPTRGHLGMAPPTRWHRERNYCKAKGCFSTPVSHLLIPEEQRKMLTADPGVSGSRETPSGTVPPGGAEAVERPITAQERGGDSSAVASDRLQDKQQPHLNNTRAGLSVGGESESCERERKSSERERESESPWDCYAPAADRFTQSSSSAESFLQRLSQVDGRSTITGPPLQLPHPTPQSSAHQGDPPTTTDPPNLTSLNSSEHPPGVCVEQFLTDAPQNIPHHVSHAPPAKKSRCDVHADGSSFSYSYTPSPNVSAALSRTKVPEQLVRWAVAYLGTSGRSPIVSGGVELRTVAMLN